MQTEHDRLVQIAAASGLPPPPARPARGECCERFCEICIWDYYERTLTRWRERNAIADIA